MLISIKGLRDEIQDAVNHFDGVLPERHAVAWRAQLAGYLDAGVIDRSEYDELMAMVPAADDDPVRDIAAFEEGRLRPAAMSEALQSDLRARIQRDLDRFDGQMPERVAIAWYGYLHALTLSEVINRRMDYDLAALLPHVHDRPIEVSHNDVEYWGWLIEHDLERFGDPLPELYAIAWRGYLTALWEWDDINTRTYRELVSMVPVDDDPCAHIWREHDRARWREEGRRFGPKEVAAELRPRIEHALERFGGDMPEHETIAWKAYLWGMLEAPCDSLSDEDYEELFGLLPPWGNKQVIELFRYRKD